MEQSRRDMQPIDLLLRIEEDLEALQENTTLFYPIVNLNIVRTLERVGFLIAVLVQEALQEEEKRAKGI